MKPRLVAKISWFEPWMEQLCHFWETILWNYFIQQQNILIKSDSRDFLQR